MHQIKNSTAPDTGAFSLLPFQQWLAFADLQDATFPEAPAPAFPPAELRFNALMHTAPEAVRCVWIGQDPYHQPGQAHGLAFSVPDGVRIPPSLRNIFKEMASDLNVATPSSGNLTYLAKQGVLLLNTCLSVAPDRPGSHAKLGWQAITQALVKAISQKGGPCVFMLWGSHAQALGALIDAPRHLILTAPHPSPLSAHRGFFGCKHFSRANQWLREKGRPEVDWVGQNR